VPNSSDLRLENWIGPVGVKFSKARIDGVLATTPQHPLGGGVQLNHYGMAALLGGTAYRPGTMRNISGDVVFFSDWHEDVDIDIGFRSPEHREIPAPAATSPRCPTPISCTSSWLAVNGRHPETRDAPSAISMMPRRH
jgi:hypothetical protein